jgi:hypothetical protein
MPNLEASAFSIRATTSTPVALQREDDVPAVQQCSHIAKPETLYERPKVRHRDPFCSPNVVYAAK